MTEWLPRTGSIIFIGAVLMACAAAVAHTLEAAYGNCSDANQRHQARRHLRQGCTIAAILASAQVIFLALCYTVSWMRPAAGIAFFYLGCTLPVPFLWAAGRAEQHQLGWPKWHGQWLSKKRLLALAGLALSGVAIAMIAFYISGAQPGASVQEMSRRAESVTSLAVIAIWLMINAPWIEEIVFRHYMLARLARPRTAPIAAASVTTPHQSETTPSAPTDTPSAFHDTPSAIHDTAPSAPSDTTPVPRPDTTRTATIITAVAVTSIIFALGHAGHTIPIWPKLVQMLVWGAALGAIRIWLGTLWAVGLHLLWNLAAPIVAMVL